MVLYDRLSKISLRQRGLFKAFISRQLVHIWKYFHSPYIYRKKINKINKNLHLLLGHNVVHTSMNILTTQRQMIIKLCQKKPWFFKIWLDDVEVMTSTTLFRFLTIVLLLPGYALPLQTM